MPSVRILKHFTNYRLYRSIPTNLKKLNINWNYKRNYSNGACDTKLVKGLVVGLYKSEGDSDPKLTSIAEKFDDRAQGKLVELVREAKLSGTLGKGKVFNNIDPDFRSVAVVGLGREGAGYNELEMLDEGMEFVRVASGVGARALQEQGCTEIHIDAMEYPEQAAEGSSLAVYRYQDNRKKTDRILIPKLELYDSPDVDAWTRGLFKAEAQNLTRRLSDTPANQMTPTSFAQAAVDALCPCGVTVEIRTMDWIEQNQLNSFLIVARGSCEPPVLLEITYCGTQPEDKPILIVGSGVTFNSGGIKLKRSEGMDEFRGSMTGAAIVVAAMRAAAALSLPINITGVIPLCENMPSGMACKPGDVITCLNGKTISIKDTEMIAPVIMADPLLYGQNTYKPRMVIDVADVAQGVKKAFGGGAAGIFSNSHYVWKEFQKAGSLTGDRVWRMPLWDYYKQKVCDNVSFDIQNRGRGDATSCNGAAVINQFVPCSDWAHIDISGVGLLSFYGTVPYLMQGRMTGRPTRTLIQFLYQMACGGDDKK